jgi:hypothetical protein
MCHKLTRQKMKIKTKTLSDLGARTLKSALQHSGGKTASWKLDSSPSSV